MLKLKITVDDQAFDFEGEAPFAELVGLVTSWLKLVTDTREAQHAINELAARAGASTDTLQAAVTKNTPE